MNIKHEFDLLFELGIKLFNEFKILNKNIVTLDIKSTNDAVTNVDFSMEKTAVKEISKIDPSSSILSEERKHIVKNKSCTWLIDPLDGTSNFIQGIKPVAISIAKIDNNIVTHSLVVNLSSSEIYTAVKGSGSRYNNLPIKKLNSNINLIGISSGFLNKGGKLPKGFNSRILGSQAIHLCNVATGSFSGCLNFESKAWDDAAGSLIIEESGGIYMNKYPDSLWIDLAINNISLKSMAANSLNDYEIFRKLMENL